MLQSKNLRTLFVLTLSLLGPTVLLAQQTTATIVGTITDPSKAGVANAAVALTNNETGVRRETRTDGAGNYSVPFLVAGEYKISVVAAGFRPSEVPSVLIQLGQTARVDAQLEVGDVNQSVNVAAHAVE